MYVNLQIMEAIKIYIYIYYRNATRVVYVILQILYEQSLLKTHHLLFLYRCIWIDNFNQIYFL